MCTEREPAGALSRSPVRVAAKRCFTRRGATSTPHCRPQTLRSRRGRRHYRPSSVDARLLVGGAVARRAKQKRVAVSASRKRNRSSPVSAPRVGSSAPATIWPASAGAPQSRGLTVTELKVAQLVADGMSNREVAAALFVSEKTVEATVSRVLAKLAIRSRAGLARRLQDLPPTGVPR